MYEQFYDGIVGQAVVASLGVFAACLVLYGARIVKVTRRFVAVVVGATLGIGLLYLAAWFLSLFGADLLFLSRQALDPYRCVPLRHRHPSLARV